MTKNKVNNIASYIYESAQEYPYNIALKLEDISINYSDLNYYIRKFQTFLSQKLKGREHCNISILSFKSIDAIALCQAALRCGFSYTVIDPRYPVSRIKNILKESSPALLYSDQDVGVLLELKNELKNSIILNEVHVDVAIDKKYNLNDVRSTVAEYEGIIPLVDNDLVAFVIYTSGSTGAPKGVEITHANASFSIEWANKEFNFTQDEVFLNQAHMGFDFCVLDYYNAWKSSASVILIPEYTAVFSPEVVRIIFEEKVTNLWLVPSNVISLIENGNLFSIDSMYIKRFLYAGEPFPINYLKLVDEWLGDAEIYNLYGPCETNLLTYYKVVSNDYYKTNIPIGYSLPETDLKLLNENGEIYHVGKGELIANSPSVFSGYANDGNSRDNYFIKHEGKIWYRTGDICMIDDDSCIHYIGRTDGMVKVRGYRVELSEIEITFNKHPKVRRTVVLAKKTSDKRSNELFVFCVVEDGCDEENLRSFVGLHLPAYMLPNKISIISNIPFNDRGKVDKNKLLEDIA